MADPPRISREGGDDEASQERAHRWVKRRERWAGELAPIAEPLKNRIELVGEIRMGDGPLRERGRREPWLADEAGELAIERDSRRGADRQATHGSRSSDRADINAVAGHAQV